MTENSIPDLIFSMNPKVGPASMMTFSWLSLVSRSVARMFATEISSRAPSISYNYRTNDNFISVWWVPPSLLKTNVVSYPDPWKWGENNPQNFCYWKDCTSVMQPFDICLQETYEKFRKSNVDEKTILCIKVGLTS